MVRQSWYAALVVTYVWGLCGAAGAQEQPTPEHEALKKLAGDWDAVVISDEGKSKGEAEYEMSLNGLWLESEFKMEDGSFSGKGMDTYDPKKKKYVGVWFDSMSTSPMIFEGDLDADGKTLNQTGTGVGHDGKPITARSVTKYVDDDHMTFELFMNDPTGKETKVLTIEYTREK